MLYFFDLPDMRPGLPTMPGSPPPPVGPCGNGPRMPNPQQPNMAFGNSNDFRPNPPGVMSTGTDMLRKQLEQNQPSIKSPMNSQMSHGAMGGPGSISGSSLLMQQLEKQPPCNPDPKVINQVAGTLANKVPTDNLHNLLPNQQQPSTSQEMKMEVKTEPDFKTEIKEEPDDFWPDLPANSSQVQLDEILRGDITREMLSFEEQERLQMLMNNVAPVPPPCGCIQVGGREGSYGIYYNQLGYGRDLVQIRWQRRLFHNHGCHLLTETNPFLEMYSNSIV